MMSSGRATQSESSDAVFVVVMSVCGLGSICGALAVVGVAVEDVAAGAAVSRCPGAGHTCPSTILHSRVRVSRNTTLSSGAVVVAVMVAVALAVAVAVVIISRLLDWRALLLLPTGLSGGVAALETVFPAGTT